MINNDIDKSEVNNLKDMLKFLLQFSKYGITPQIETQIISCLDKCLNFFVWLTREECFPEICRLTINRTIFGSNKRINAIKYLKYPPEKKVTKYGRCNLPGQSILYASFGDMTVLNELKPNKGDLITITKWRAKDGIKIKYCPIFKNQPPGKSVMNPRTFRINQDYEEELEKYPPNLKEIFNVLVQFVADSFTKEIIKDNHLNYIFSAYFSNKIFHVYENSTIEAIYYPSVQDSLSFENLAIKPETFDNKYDLISIKEGVVDLSPSSGGRGYMILGTAECKYFNLSTDEIFWDESKPIQPKEILTRLILDYRLDLNTK